MKSNLIPVSSCEPAGNSAYTLEVSYVHNCEEGTKVFYPEWRITWSQFCSG
jgi:hypothetical protein